MTPSDRADISFKSKKVCGLPQDFRKNSFSNFDLKICTKKGLDERVVYCKNFGHIRYFYRKIYHW